MPKSLVRETTTAAVGEAAERGVVPITVASPGWGSSGWYSPQVLENAVSGRVFGQGLHLYWNHPSESERHDRPERSVTDLVGVLTEDATWDPQQGIVAEAKIFGPYRDLFRDKDFVNAIGVSLRAFADTTVGEAEGRKGTIITDLIEAQSVDFVTKAGRGGKVMAALESARTQARVATANDTREALTAAVRSAHAEGDDTWAWVRDFDDTRVWFDVEGPDEWATYEQGYSLDDAGTASLADGDPTPVRARTEYVPITPDADSGAGSTSAPAPAGQSTANESQEMNMATTQIEESELGRLRQDAERVPTLESERDTANRERNEAREALAARDRTDAARVVIATQAREAGVTFSALEERGLLAALPATEAGDLDEDNYATSVKEAAAVKAEEAGAGKITGFGHTDTTVHVVESADDDVAAAFGRTAQKGA